MDATNPTHEGRVLRRNSARPCPFCGAAAGMNAKVEPITGRNAPVASHAGGIGTSPEAPARHTSAPESSSDLVIREGMLEVPGEVLLHHGGRLSGMRIAW